jgi:DNA-binding response OmpR family regulator
MQGGRLSKLVLVVEDRPLHAKLLSELLRACGYLSITALTGWEGLAAAGVTEPDLIIVDISLPDTDGREVIGEFRRRSAFAQTPIIAVSSLGDHDLAYSCALAGANAFLAKPLRLGAISETVAGLLAPAG